MGRTGAYLQVERREHGVRPAREAVADYGEFALPLSADEQREQASRCMNCGVAFCQSGGILDDIVAATGCPLHNLIPEVNDLLYRGRLDDAYARLLLTNPFPEFTGRVCPAPCEVACNLGLHDDAVTIHDNERLLSDHGWSRGMRPLVPAPDTAPLVSVVGSGPAGLALAWELARRGVRVRVYERDERPGGLLTYGIPNMKLPKEVVQRRIDLMRDSGVEFACGTNAAQMAGKILSASDAVVLAVGSSVARDMPIEGRELDGVHLALDYLGEVTRALLEGRDATIDAAGKDVVVIGGGDTGVDCVACALRQGAKSVRQVIRAQRPSGEGSASWPGPRAAYTQGYGQREAEELLGSDPRIWSTDTIAFMGDGTVEAVCIQDLAYDGGRHLVEETQREIPAQLVLIAKGFLGADDALFEAFGVTRASDADGLHGLQAVGDATVPVYVAGDARMGSTLVATAIADGLACADEVCAALRL